MSANRFVATREQSEILREMQKGGALIVDTTRGDGKGVLKKLNGRFKNVRKVTLDLLLKKGAIKPSIIYLGIQSYSLTKLWELNIYKITRR
jgi:hypothetical protein